MDIKEQAADHKTDEETLQSIPQTKISERQKILWNSSSSDIESYPTFVLNYKFNTQHKGLGAIPKRRQSTMATSKTEKPLKSVEQDCDIYNLRNLYHMSSDSLCDFKSKTSSTLNKASTSTAVMTAPLGGGKGCGSRHTTKIEIFSLPPEQQALTEERPFIHFTTREVGGCKRSYTASDGPCEKCERSKQGKGKCSTHSFKLEIFHMPITQNVESEKIPIKFSQIIPQEAEVMVISGNDDTEKHHQLQTPQTDRKRKPTDMVVPEVNIELPDKQVKTEEHPKHTDRVECHEPEVAKPDITIDKDKSLETARNPEISKSTQKPEFLIETPSQTSECDQNRLLQIPSFSSSSTTPYNSLPRASTGAMSYRYRQLELHRLRVRVEKKRLELLEMKLNHEREERQRDKMLFEKKLEMNRWMCKELNEEIDA